MGRPGAAWAAAKRPSTHLDALAHGGNVRLVKLGGELLDGGISMAADLLHDGSNLRAAPRGASETAVGIESSEAGAGWMASVDGADRVKDAGEVYARPGDKLLHIVLRQVSIAVLLQGSPGGGHRMHHH